MTHQILRVILGGILAGTLIYFFPFIVPIVATVFLIGFIIRLIAGPAHWGWRGRAYFNEKLKNMSEEERKAFLEKYGYGCTPIFQRDAEVKSDLSK